MYFIGVDGGATKSTALLFSGNKRIAERKGKDLNYHSVGEAAIKKNLKELLRPFFSKYKPIKGVAFGFAGLDTDKDERIYRKIVASVLPKGTKFVVLNDAETALEDACPDKTKPRVLIISGTGATVLGEYKGKQMNAIGWDFILGDDGSAFWQGLKGLRAAVRSWDGRLTKSLLEKAVVRKSKVKDIHQLIDLVYKNFQENPREIKKYIASFAPVVDEVALKGDRAAREIITDAALELARGFEAVIKRLGAENSSICCGFTGSNFKTPGLKEKLAGEIKKIAPKTTFVYNVSGAKGAVKLARKL